jgi:hypothetical protein
MRASTAAVFGYRAEEETTPLPPYLQTPPVDLLLSVDPGGHPVFIIQFRKGVSSRDESLANRARLTRG